MLTRRENLLRVMCHERGEWAPICGHVDPYNQPNRRGMDPALAERLGTVRWGDEGSIHFSRWLGIDVMDWCSGPPVRVGRRCVTTERTTEGDDTVTVWHTPAGDLREVSRRCREDGTSYRLEHVLKRVDDIPRLAALFADEVLEADPARATEIAARRDVIGDDGIVGMPMPSTPLGMLIRNFAGVEATVLLAADAPDAFADLLAVMETNYLERLRLAAPCAADAFITVDDTSTTTISPRIFEQFCLGYTDRAADIVHAAGKCYWHHSCGHIRDLLPLYRRTRMDGVHAFTIPPIGNVSVADGRRALGEGITIYAGLVQLFGPLDDWDAVRASVRDMFAGAAPGNDFILGLGADPDKTMAETKRLVDECRPYQALMQNS